MSAHPIGVPAPPDLCACSIHILSAGAILHRIHDGRFGACQFNPGLGHSRFAPFEIAGTKVPTAYGATSLECAVFETIFHDIDASAAFKSVRWSALEPLRYSQVRVNRDIRLASLFSADLMKLGLERSQLIDTHRSSYDATQRWSSAIHGSAGAPDGMIWMSRRYDQEMALILFGDRVVSADLEPVQTVSVTNDAATLQVISDQARRAGIVITR